MLRSLIIAVLLSSWTPSALAWMCGSPSIKSRFQDVDLVFDATVINVKYVEDDRQLKNRLKRVYGDKFEEEAPLSYATMRVHETFKGKVPRTVQVWAVDHQLYLLPHFGAGQRAVFFIQQAENGALISKKCLSTHPSADPKKLFLTADELKQYFQRIEFD